MKVLSLPTLAAALTIGFAGLSAACHADTRSLDRKL